MTTAVAELLVCCNLLLVVCPTTVAVSDGPISFRRNVSGHHNSIQQYRQTAPSNPIQLNTLNHAANAQNPAQSIISIGGDQQNFADRPYLQSNFQRKTCPPLYKCENSDCELSKSLTNRNGVHKLLFTAEFNHSHYTCQCTNIHGWSCFSEMQSACTEHSCATDHVCYSNGVLLECVARVTTYAIRQCSNNLCAAMALSGDCLVIHGQPKCCLDSNTLEQCKDAYVQHYPREFTFVHPDQMDQSPDYSQTDIQMVDWTENSTLHYSIAVLFLMSIFFVVSLTLLICGAHNWSCRLITSRSEYERWKEEAAGLQKNMDLNQIDLELQPIELDRKRERNTRFKSDNRNGRRRPTDLADRDMEELTPIHVCGQSVESHDHSPTAISVFDENLLSRHSNFSEHLASFSEEPNSMSVCVGSAHEPPHNVTATVNINRNQNENLNYPTSMTPSTASTTPSNECPRQNQQQHQQHRQQSNGNNNRVLVSEIEMYVSKTC